MCWDILMLPTHIYCFTFTSTCSLFYDPVIVSHYLPIVLYLQSKCTQTFPKFWMITIPHIHKIYYTRNTSLNLRIFSANIKTKKRLIKYQSILFMYNLPFIKVLLYTPWQWPTGNGRMMWEFYCFICKSLSALVGIFLNFIDVIPMVGGLLLINWKIFWRKGSWHTRNTIPAFAWKGWEELRKSQLV